jgi:hypothetical protein
MVTTVELILEPINKIRIKEFKKFENNFETCKF